MNDNATEEKRTDLLIRDMVEVVKARRRGLELALEMGFVLPEATKIAVVISELARNIINYAGQGTITLIIYGPPERCFEIVARDRGPGIADVPRVLAGGYSTSGGLGKGISGSRRLMDVFVVNSRPGFGTTIKAVRNLR
jgi:serine/threonine-protein kinase RsbT